MVTEILCLHLKTNLARLHQQVLLCQSMIHESNLRRHWLTINYQVSAWATLQVEKLKQAREKR